MDIIQVDSLERVRSFIFFVFLVREALRQINIQMIDSSNLYDGLESLWLSSADESLTNQQVCPYFERFLSHSVVLVDC